MLLAREWPRPTARARIFAGALWAPPGPSSLSRLWKSKRLGFVPSDVHTQRAPPPLFEVDRPTALSQPGYEEATPAGGPRPSAAPAEHLRAGARAGAPFSAPVPRTPSVSPWADAGRSAIRANGPVPSTAPVPRFYAPGPSLLRGLPSRVPRTAAACCLRPEPTTRRVYWLATAMDGRDLRPVLPWSDVLENAARTGVHRDSFPVFGSELPPRSGRRENRPRIIRPWVSRSRKRGGGSRRPWGKPSAR